MCGPAAIAPLAIAGAVASAGAQLYAGAAARSQGRYQQDIAQQNAQMERRAANDAVTRGQTAQLQRYRQLSQSLGAQRAALAANGLDLSFGSAMDTQLDTAQIAYEDSATLAENTRREVQGYDINAANYTMKGRAARAEGNAAFVSGAIGAVGTLLGGASQVSKMRAQSRIG